MHEYLHRNLENITKTRKKFIRNMRHREPLPPAGGSSSSGSEPTYVWGRPVVRKRSALFRREPAKRDTVEVADSRHTSGKM